MKRIVAIIPARGGSRGIPRKNIVPFCGKPLLAWSILQARAAQKVDAVYVSTDDAEIARVARSYGAKVIDRPAEISGDTATSESALLHAVTTIEKGGTDIRCVVFLQATSPLREASDIDTALRAFISEKADSLFSAVLIDDLAIWKRAAGKLVHLNPALKERKRRQDCDEQYAENGSIYIFTPEILRIAQKRFGGRIAVSCMEHWKIFEIDTPEGLAFCRSLFQLQGLHKRSLYAPKTT